MTQNTFWMNKNVYTPLGGKGFFLFSIPHLIWLAVLFAAIALFAFYTAIIVFSVEVIY